MAKKHSVDDANTLWKKTWPKIVARAWADPAFKNRLKKNPQAVAKEYGLPLLENTEYKVKAGRTATRKKSQHTVVLDLPAKPKSLKVESLEELSAHAEQKHCSNSSCA